MTSLLGTDRLYRLTPDELLSSGERRLLDRLRQLRRLRLTWLGAVVGVLVLGAGAAVSAISVDADYGGTLAELARAAGPQLIRLRWQFAASVLVLAAAHYLSTAFAARCVSGLRLPIGESVLVQFAAAAANRLTPAGLGGAAVNARYFSRRGLEPAAALGSVALLSAIGPLADVLLFGLVIAVGRWIGLTGAAGELSQLTGKLGRLTSLLHSPVAWLALSVLVALVWLAHRQLRVGWPGFWQPVRRVLHSPRILLALLGASAVTTLVMALAFACSVAMTPGPQPTVPTGALVALFMLGSAAGSAVPVPSGLGSTEAALTAVLVGVGVPVGNAIVQVLLFRTLTFWLPALLGVLATRRLRRRGAF